MNLNDYLIPDFDLTGNLTPEDTLYGLLSDDEEITGYLGLIEDIALSELSDVTLTSPVNGQVLKYDNGTWVNANESGGGSSDYNLLLNKPSINSVPLTGNKTTAELGLFSGDYDDLTNKPTLATVATTGDYNDLSNRPTIPAAQVNSDWDAVAGVSQILNKPSLATVATTGDYDDLINTPSLATVATSGDYDDLINKPTIPTSCSIARGSTMPGTFPVPQISRRGNTVIIRVAIELPAGSYTTSQVLWNYSPAMVDFPALTFPVYGSGEVNLIKILPDGTITMNNNKTFNANTWLIGEAVFLTDG